MNDQLLEQGGGGKSSHTHSHGASSSAAFSSALHSPFDDESEALNKPEGKITLIDESLDFEDLESTMWRKGSKYRVPSLSYHHYHSSYDKISKENICKYLYICILCVVCSTKCEDSSRIEGIGGPPAERRLLGSGL